MPTESKERKLEKYRNWIDQSKQWRAKFEPDWRECLDIYAHRHRWAMNDKPSSYDTVSVNMVHPAINAIQASTTIEFPEFTFTAKNPADADRVRVQEAVLNCVWRRLHFQDHVIASAKDNAVMGHAWIKVGWLASGTERELTEQELQRDREGIAELFATLSLEDPVQAMIRPTDDEVEQGLSSTIFEADVDEPHIERVSPFRMLVDPFGTSMDNIRWIAQQVIMPLEEAREHKHWRPSVRKKLAAMSTSDVTVRDYGMGAQEECDEFVEIIELYDLRYGTVCQFAESGDGFLLDPRPMPHPFDHPFVMLRNHDVPDEFYPLGEVHIVKDQQYLLDKIRTEQVRTLAHFTRKYMGPESVVGRAGFAAKVASCDTDIVVPVPDDQFAEYNGQPLREFPSPQIPPDFWAMGNQTQADLERGMAVLDYQLGGSPGGGRTATEAALLNASQQARAQQKLARVEKFMARVGEKVHAMMQVWLTAEDYVELVGEDGSGQSELVPYRRETLFGDYDILVEAGSTTPNNDQLRRQRALEFINAFLPIAQLLVQQGFQINWTELVKFMLSDGFGIRDAGRFIQDPGGLGGIAAAPGALPGTVPGGPAPAGAGQPPGAQQFPAPEQQLAQLAGQVGLDLA